MQLINNAAASSNTNNRVYKPRIFSESDVSACRSQTNKHMSLEVADNTKALKTNHAII